MSATGGGVLIVAGPTASGKTELALALAQRFSAEIVGADSRQIYRGMEIGTAAPTYEQRSLVPHHLIEVLDPYERYSAARYAIDAMRAITSINARKKRVIVVGGTGFYLRALLGRVTLAPQYDAELRERLVREASLHPAEFLHAWLGIRDRSRAAELHPRDIYRVMRALEVALAVTDAPDRGRRLPTLLSSSVPYFYAVVDVPFEELDRRIERRVDTMLGAGLAAEAERIGPNAAAATAVGYPQAIAWTRGWSTMTELRTSLIRATRRYARRQRVWFRAEPNAIWLAPEAIAAAAREKLGWR